MKKSTITVRGKSIKRIPPDTIEISFLVKAIDRDYSKMIDISNYQINTMQSIIEKVGFEKKQLRIQNYTINAKYRSVLKTDDEYENVFEGYECRQDFLLKFPINMPMLHKVLRSIDLCDIKPEFNIEFTLKNSQAVRDEALHEAAINAKREAKIIVKAINAKLGELRNVRISDNNYSHSVLGINMGTTSLISSNESCNIQPDSIEIEASAEFIWEIVNK